jgi:intracellular sulfur oxidation DsrE/DsrF family protein
MLRAQIQPSHLTQGDAAMQPSIHAHRVAEFRRNATALSAAVAVCLSLALPLPGHAADAVQPNTAAAKISDKERVVFQVSDGDPKKWNLALNNVKNVQDALGKDKVDVELVVYGPGIDMLKLESAAGNRVDDAIADGVRVVACENTMAAQNLTKADMLKSIGYVPAGVIELIKRQQQGYAYIRP